MSASDRRHSFLGLSLRNYQRIDAAATGVRSEERERNMPEMKKGLKKLLGKENGMSDLLVHVSGDI